MMVRIPLIWPGVMQWRRCLRKIWWSGMAQCIWWVLSFSLACSSERCHASSFTKDTASW